MSWISTLRPKADAGLLLAARTSQALAIVSTDSALSLGARTGVVPVHLLKRLHYGIGKRLIGEPAAFLDEAYDVTQRLLDLHREFGHRLVEVLDPRAETSSEPADPSLGQVLPFPARVAQSSL